MTYIELLCILMFNEQSHGSAKRTIMGFNKDLTAASSTPIVLAILSEADSYGYAIIKRVQDLSRGHMEWTDGMLYPVLHRLERLGYIKAHWELAESGRRRKYYRITSRGRHQLAVERRQWQAVDATLRGIWKALSVSISSNHPASALPAEVAFGTQAGVLLPQGA